MTTVICSFDPFHSRFLQREIMREKIGNAREQVTVLLSSAKFHQKIEHL